MIDLNQTNLCKALSNFSCYLFFVKYCSIFLRFKFESVVKPKSILKNDNQGASIKVLLKNGFGIKRSTYSICSSNTIS